MVLGIMKNEPIKNPNFLLVGYHKTGTTWLYKNLQQIDGVSLPPKKELCFFWTKYKFPQLNLFTILFNNNWYFKTNRRYLLGSMVLYLKQLLCLKPNIKKVIWDIRYFLLLNSIRHYKKLFPKDSISGDMSPNYIELPDNEISRIKEQFPYTKIIIGLRDPVEREWSWIKKNIIYKRKIKDISRIKSVYIILKESRFDNNDYAKHIEKWTTIFGTQNVFYYFYDELENNPFLVLNSICKFLNVNIPIGFTPDTSHINKSDEQKLPEEIRIFLYNINKNYYMKMRDYFEEPFIIKWCNKYQDLNS